jgi:hypothetical protein
MTIAFVLGNGRSRLNADLNQLKQYGKIYGCNALYREFAPNFLIAVDMKMIFEICASGYHLTNQVWTNPNKQYEKYKNLNFFNKPRGWASGPTALLKACMDNNLNIFILGFDYVGINNKINNVYADTLNYKKTTDNAIYFGNWIKQTIKVMNEYPHVTFFRVSDETIPQIKELSTINNLSEININQMNDILGLKT